MTRIRICKCSEFGLVSKFGWNYARADNSASSVHCGHFKSGYDIRSHCLSLHGVISDVRPSIKLRQTSVLHLFALFLNYERSPTNLFLSYVYIIIVCTHWRHTKCLPCFIGPRTEVLLKCMRVPHFHSSTCMPCARDTPAKMKL